MTQPTKRLHRLRILAVATTMAFAGPALAGRMNASAVKADGKYDQFIVRFNDNAPERGNAAARQRLLDTVGHGTGVSIAQLRRLAVGADVIKTDRKLDSLAARRLMTQLAKNTHVDYIELDARRKAAFTPNDTNYFNQWHYWETAAGIRAPSAWDHATGTGVVVAVIDTGITPHSDLSANVIAGYDFISYDLVHDYARDGDGRDANPNDEGDWTTAGDCDDPTWTAEDSSWHGTHVAGTVAAVTNNSKGVAGVAFNAKIEPVRVLGRCGGSTSDIADAIVWASGGHVSGIPFNANPAEVINLSLGGPGACDFTSQAAIDTAVANGTVVVVAAGNDASDAAGFSPASCDNVITVAALSRLAHRASYSNFGANVDIAAPGGDGGDNVLSTINTGTTIQSTEGYAGFQGTSMATPHVAGTVALMQSVHVNSPAFVEAIIKKNKRGFPSACVGCGAGIVDANAAVLAANTPTMIISDVKSVEGDGGMLTRLAVFTVQLSQAIGSDVTFDIATTNGTATAGSDFDAITLTGESIPAGQTSKTYSVALTGDTTVEPNEAFLVNVSNIVGAGISVADSQAVGTIINDDATVLTNGVPVSVPNGTANQQFFYSLLVPTNSTGLVFNTTGGTGDADLYVKLGSMPTSSSYHCVSGGPTTTESCSINGGGLVGAGTYYVMVNAFSDISGVSVTGSYTPGSGPSLSIGDVTLNEGNGGTRTATFTVTSSRTSEVPVTFDIATANGTATAGSDYLANGATGQSIPGGAVSKTFDVTINGDNEVEPDETFFVNLSNVTGGTIADGQAVGTITNDDVFVPLLTINDVSISEGNSGTKTLNFTVHLSGPSSTPVTYDIATTNGTATAGSDYVTSSLIGQTIPAGQTNKTFSVTLNGDTTIEPNETFFVNVSNITDATHYESTQGVGTISNDDVPSLSINDVAISEGNSGTKLLSFTISLSQAAASAVTYNIATANGTAAAGSDYVASSLTSQMIPAGNLSKSFNVTLNGDAAIEANETFTVTLSNASGATISDAQAIGTISNDDVPSLSIGDATISEGNSGTKTLTFTVHLSQAASTGVTYNIATAAGSATAGNDYVANSLNSQLIPAGNLSKSFNVTINGDATIEPNETFTANLSGASGATISDAQAIGTISNDDVPSLSISDAAISEGNSGTKTLTFTVHLSAAASTGVTYNIATANGSATAGSDYVANSLSNQLIPAGNLSKSFNVTLNGDTAIEANETLTATISSASGATISDAQAIGTISNDDVPSLSIGDVATSEGNSGTKTLTFTVHLSQAASTGVTYNIATAAGTATAGSDYVANSLNSQLIPAGNLSKSFVVTLNGDTTVEPNETFTTNLSGASGATISDNQAIGTINNDD